MIIISWGVSILSSHESSLAQTMRSSAYWPVFPIVDKGRGALVLDPFRLASRVPYDHDACGRGTRHFSPCTSTNLSID